MMIKVKQKKKQFLYLTKKTMLCQLLWMMSYSILCLKMKKVHSTLDIQHFCASPIGFSTNVLKIKPTKSFASLSFLFYIEWIFTHTTFWGILVRMFFICISYWGLSVIWWDNTQNPLQHILSSLFKCFLLLLLFLCF